MSVSYDEFTGAFLNKINDYDFIDMSEEDRVDIVDDYMKKAIAAFKKNCKYDLTTTANDTLRVFDIDIADEDLDEIKDIIAEGMVVQWLKPLINKQELLENRLNTSDFSTYSPAELLYRMTSFYSQTRKEFTQHIREYSYNHGRLDTLHI